MKETQRTGAREHQTLDLCTIECKDPMSFSADVEHATILAQSQDPEHFDTQFLLLLNWNTVLHIENTANSKMDLFGILYDAFLDDLL
jgi:hypothetical protein